jgi:flagellar protein FlaI
MSEIERYRVNRPQASVTIKTGGYHPILNQPELTVKRVKMIKLPSALDEQATTTIKTTKQSFFHYTLNEPKLTVREEETIKLPSAPDEKIQSYWVNPPHASVTIKKTKEGFHYILNEPKLTVREEKTLKLLRERLYSEFSVKNIPESPFKAQELLKQEVSRILSEFGSTEQTKSKLYYYVLRDKGYAKIDALIRDPNVEDISCPKPRNPVFVYHRTVEYVDTNISFTQEELDDFIIRLAYMGGEHISVAVPSVDVSLPLKLRGHLCYRTEITPEGSNFQLRKWQQNPISIIQCIKYRTLTAEMAAYLWLMIQHRSSLVVGGITASGKTTALNALATLIPANCKVASCEDTAELRLPHTNWTSFVTRSGGIERNSGAARQIDLSQLVKNTLRQRPDFVIIGEVRGEEAFALFLSASSGQLALCTIHAGDVTSMLQRLQAAPMNVPVGLVTCINVIVMMRKTTDERGLPVRKMIEVCELLGYDSNRRSFILNPIFRWDTLTHSFTSPNPSKLLDKIALQYGHPREQLQKEIRRRAEYLNLLAEKNVLDSKAIAHLVWLYQQDPEEAVRTVLNLRLRQVVPVKTAYTEKEKATIFAEVARCYQTLYGHDWKKEIERIALETFNLDPSEQIPAAVVQHVVINEYNRIVSQAMGVKAEVRVESPIKESIGDMKERMAHLEANKARTSLQEKLKAPLIRTTGD